MVVRLFSYVDPHPHGYDLRRVCPDRRQVAQLRRNKTFLCKARFVGRPGNSCLQVLGRFTSARLNVHHESLKWALEMRT